ncbi:VOC family protein [Melghirimyces algeriensis]|uniref:Catechol 2,3-dioxygenase n=1 Tax=Melghirimyces algeriensis TaxID=910412 RepID=A0A521DKX4_9BACL|nr:VOC family protein [Melghirimyces algeriensis]SMO71751.1 Catechol 2,3-dioxygenase [Melghirimyces algeriensis]
MQPLSIHHVQITIPKGSEAKAQHFYCDIMGLEEIPKPSSLAGRGGFWLRLGDMEIHIGTEDGVDRTRTKAHSAYLVEDLTAWRHHLMRQGVEIQDSIPIPGYQRFELRDPFGNRMELIERK